MARLTDLIVKAKNGKPVKQLFSLHDEQPIETCLNDDVLLEKITRLETLFFEQGSESVRTQSRAFINELENILSEI